MRYFQAYTQYEVDWFEKCISIAQVWNSSISCDIPRLSSLSWVFSLNVWFFLPVECRQWQLLPLRVTISLPFPVLKPLSFVNWGFFVIYLTFVMIIRGVLEQSCIQNSTTFCLFKCTFCLWPSCSSHCPTYQWVHRRSRWKGCR